MGPPGLRGDACVAMYSMLPESMCITCTCILTYSDTQLSAHNKSLGAAGPYVDKLSLIY